MIHISRFENITQLTSMATQVVNVHSQLGTGEIFNGIIKGCPFICHSFDMCVYYLKLFLGHRHTSGDELFWIAIVIDQMFNLDHTVF